jgi:ABC-type glycerol-3-phosphate transport system substrate-binding protein
MFTFDGDKAVKIDLVSPQAIEAVSWWRGFVDDGVTQVGEMPFTDAWQNGLAAMGEIEVWFSLINLRDAGKKDIYDDIGVVAVPPKQGVNPTVFAGGWHLVSDRKTKQSDARWQFMSWMMHKPAMPFSRFIVERIGALPAPIDYPAEVPGWSADLLSGYAKETTAIAGMVPWVKVLGSGEIEKVVSTAIQSVMLKKQTPEEAMKEINPRVNEILQRTEV